MGEKLEALWLVIRLRVRQPGVRTPPNTPVKVFRSRDAARAYAKAKRTKRCVYSVRRITWGPEQ